MWTVYEKKHKPITDEKYDRNKLPAKHWTASEKLK